MKHVYNTLKEPLIRYLKKDAITDIVKVTGVSIQEKMQTVKTSEDDIDKELYKQQMYFLQPKIDNNFNYIKYLELKNSKLVGIKKFGLNNILYQQFGTSNVNEEKIIMPQIHTGGDFGKLVKESTIFIDKSLFIKEIIEDKSEVILITMPRRWGKSLNLDMLKRFLSIEEQNPTDKSDNQKMFNHKIKKIGTEKAYLAVFNTKVLQSDPENIGEVKEIPILDLQGQCPVIFIDFKDCKGVNVQGVRSNLQDKILETIRNFSYLQNSEKPYKDTVIKEEYTTLLNSVKSNIRPQAIKELSELLYAYHGKKVWILIDEYDAAANKAYLELSHTDANEISELFRSIFEPALKSNASLEKGIMTGVQYIVKSGMLSGLNNLSKYNVTSTKYSKYYGINNDEIKPLLEHFNIDEQTRVKIKDWYNGYKSKNDSSESLESVDKYNIWSVVNYLNNKNEGFKSYWEKSGSISGFLKVLFKNESFKNNMEDLVTGKSIFIGELKEDFDTENFKTLKNIKDGANNIKIKDDGLNLIYSYLFITGYLTGNDQQLQIPNKEIQREMSNYLKDYYAQIFNIPIESLSNLTLLLGQILDKDILDKDPERILKILKGDFGPTFGGIIKDLQLYDQSNDVSTVKGMFANEKAMQSILNSIAWQVVNGKFATERYTIPRLDGSKGRADIVLSKDKKGILIEMKYNKNTNIDPNLAKQQADDALKQAKTYESLLESAVEIKIFIGCNITDQQEVFLSGEIDISGSTYSFDYP